MITYHCCTEIHSPCAVLSVLHVVSDCMSLVSITDTIENSIYGKLLSDELSVALPSFLG